MNEHDFQKQANEHTRREKLARKILGLDENAGLAEIKKAYWLLAMKYHPDKNPGDRESLRKFQNIRNAYEFLTGIDEGGELEQKDETGENISEKYETENSWGYFLWWRDKYFH